MKTIYCITLVSLMVFLATANSQDAEGNIVHGANRNKEFTTSNIRIWYDDKFLHINSLNGEAIIKYPIKIFVHDYVESLDGNRVLLMLSERNIDYHGASNPFELLLVEKINGKFWARIITPKTDSNIKFTPFKFREKKSDLQNVEIEIGIMVKGDYQEQHEYIWATLNVETTDLNGFDSKKYQNEK